MHVAPHPLFRREGDDIHIELPVSLAEAVLGARVPVPTVDRPGDDDDPEGLRHRHQAAAARQGHPPRAGTAAGDQYVTLKVVIGASDDPELAEFLEELGRKRTRSTRAAT